MVFLQPSPVESAFVFSTEDGSDAIVLDIRGVYALVDGGSEPLHFMDCLRAPTAAMISTATPSSLTNALKLNEQPDSLVAVVGNLPSAAALKDAAAAEPLRQLYKTISVPPVVAQLKGAKPEPLVIHKGLSTGTLSVYTLAGDAKDAETVAKAYQSGSSEAIENAAAAASSVLLVVWQPVREDAPIKRILHLGSAPLPRIQQALDRARSLPFLQSVSASAASLKAKPLPPSRPAASSAARPSRVAPSAAPPSAKSAVRVVPSARPAAPTARAAPAARGAPSAAAPKPSGRASMPARSAAPPAAASSSAARAARMSGVAPRPAAAAAPTGRTAARGAKEEVAKKTIVGKSSAAPSSTRSSATSTPNGAASRTPSKATPSAVSSPAAAAAAAAVAATTVAAAAVVAASDSTPPISPSQHEQQPAAAATTPAISVSIDGGEEMTTPGGLPVPASPTIIPATPQPPMSPEPTDEHDQEQVDYSSPDDSPVAAGDTAFLEEDDHPIPSAPAADEQPAADEALVPSAPLEPAASVDEPECVKELVEDEPKPSPQPPSPSPSPQEDPYQPVAPMEPEPMPAPVPTPIEPEPTPAPAPTPVEPTPVGDLLGDFDVPAQPQQPGDDGLLDSLEEPMKKMQISMDTDKLAEELGLTTGEEKGEGEGEESLLDMTQTSIVDSDLDKTQNTSVIESAHELDDLLSPRSTVDEMTRKLSAAAEENLLAAAAAPFIAGLASTVVEAATIDGAKSTLESLMSNSRGVESPTGEKLLSFRSSGYENPDEPKEVKYEETDPAIDDVLTKLADESDLVNGAANHVELNGHGDSGNGHVINGNGWPEGTTMHLPPPTKNAPKEAKFKLAGPIHVDLVTVPHRGKQILLHDEAASIEFFSMVRSSVYLLQSGGEVPVHVMDGWMKGKGQWAANVPSRLVPTHSNDTINKWIHEHADELTEVGLTVATPVDSTTLTYPDGQAKACTLPL